jgi:hypothetical protein
MKEKEKITFTFKYRVVLNGTINSYKNYGYYIGIIEEDREKADAKAIDFEKHLNQVLYFRGHFRNANHELTQEEYDEMPESQRILLTDFYKKKFKWKPKVPPENIFRFIFYYKVVRNGHPEDEDIGNFIRVIEEDREKADERANALEWELNATLFYQDHQKYFPIELLTKEKFNTLTINQKELLHETLKERFKYKSKITADNEQDL